MSNSKIKLAFAEAHHVTYEGLNAWFGRSSDFSVTGSCTNGQNILELVKFSRPDILLLDLHLPGVSDMKDLVAEIVKLGTKVVIFSADSRAFCVQTALRCGISAFLLKTETFHFVSDVLRRVHNGERGLTSRNLLQPLPVTPKEQQILSSLARGRKYQDIADERGTTSETIRKQCDRIIMKLGVANREELIVWALEHGYGTSLARVSVLFDQPKYQQPSISA